MKTVVRIEWLASGRVELVSLVEYMAMRVEELEGTYVRMIEFRGVA